MKGSNNGKHLIPRIISEIQLGFDNYNFSKLCNYNYRSEFIESK